MLRILAFCCRAAPAHVLVRASRQGLRLRHQGNAAALVGLGALGRQTPDLTLDFIAGGKPHFAGAGKGQHQEAQRPCGCRGERAQPLIELGRLGIRQGGNVFGLVALLTQQSACLETGLEIDGEPERGSVGKGQTPWPPLQAWYARSAPASRAGRAGRCPRSRDLRSWE